MVFSQSKAFTPWFDEVQIVAIPAVITQTVQSMMASHINWR